MASRDRPKWLVTGVYWFLAAEFFVGAITKYWPGSTFFGPSYAVKFVDWGYPSWFRFVVGTIELVCAVMLVIPRRQFRFMGAAALVLLLTSAVTTHIVNQDVLTASVSAPIHLVIMAIVALANWPADWRELLKPWQTGHPGTARSQAVSPGTARSRATA